MAKRKPGVNDIIYELDNDDTESSSEDEVKGNKKGRSETKTSSKMNAYQSVTDKNVVDMTILSNSMDSDSVIDVEDRSQNGGKNSIVVVEDDNTEEDMNTDELDCIIVNSDEKREQRNIDVPETVILNEDITVDSPASGNGPISVEDENSSPLITIRFNNNKLAKKYKEKLKLFITDLLSNENENVITESDTELDLTVWSDNFITVQSKATGEKVDKSLFFVDTNPNEDKDNEIPKYTQVSIGLYFSSLFSKNEEFTIISKIKELCNNTYF